MGREFAGLEIARCLLWIPNVALSAVQILKRLSFPPLTPPFAISATKARETIQKDRSLLEIMSFPPALPLRHTPFCAIMTVTEVANPPASTGGNESLTDGKLHFLLVEYRAQRFW